MELKRMNPRVVNSSVLTSLNRTFYGIETILCMWYKIPRNSLNRTFYGIETKVGKVFASLVFVLIVPFMELKPMTP